MTTTYPLDAYAVPPGGTRQTDSPLRPLSQRAVRESGLRTIYGLADPRDGVIRYVGYTAGSLQQRLRNHIKASRYAVSKRQANRRHYWIASILNSGLEPVAYVLAHDVGDKWAEQEQRWINLFSALGHDLVNARPGGEVGRPTTSPRKGKTLSLETRAKISAAASKRYQDPKERAKTSKSMKGTRRSAETRAAAVRKQCPHGHKYTPENTVIYSGRKECRTCRRERGRISAARRRAAKIS